MYIRKCVFLLMSSLHDEPLSENTA